MLTTQVPSIKTALPGPHAKSILTRDEQVMSPSYTRVYPLVIKRGFGATVEDVDGNLFLDFSAGIATCSTGHCHPEVVEAVQRQAAEFLHMSGTDFYYENMVALAEKLTQITPGYFAKRVYFGNSGAEAIESAMKLARFHTRRQHFIAFINAFHGRTLGALSLTASKTIQRRHFSPLVPGVHHIPYANCRHCSYQMDYATCDLHCVEHTLESVLFKTVVAPEEVAAIFVEPIQGEGGYVVPPRDFLPALRRITDKYGILLVLDEVQSGMGRTGKFWACEHFNVTPDILISAKGLASGLPLSAMVARSDIMNWTSGMHASTFGGNPVACAAALVTIRLIEEHYMSNAERIGNYLMQGLLKLKERHSCVGDVRGLGLMLGLEIGAAPEITTDDRARRDAIVQEAFQQGLLLLGCGESGLRLCPPLVITHEEADVALRILDNALSTVPSALSTL
ncbi:MAG: acetyl ornithine aminotransferase family protein [Acidobacteria bacterium]|nr:acetyl ornithine aminotransferase family protein [Acidobacteriota bacterium]MBI3656760.1 acetyl ornithine aminotransferase family protein [Acidobacteriota bacterium]